MLNIFFNLLQYIKHLFGIVFISKCTNSKLVHDLNASLPTDEHFFDVIDFSFLHPKNALFPIFSTLLFKSIISSNSMQFTNASSSISTNSDSNTTFFNFLHPLNADVEMFFMFFGIVICSRFMQFLKHSCGINSILISGWISIFSRFVQFLKAPEHNVVKLLSSTT